MSTSINKTISGSDYSNTNFQKVSFKSKNLSNANFSGSDLRGADFSGADLSGADFSKTKTGIPPSKTALLFCLALPVSLLSGYFAMLIGRTIRTMLASSDPNVRTAGFASIVLILLFIIYAWWKGGRNAIWQLVIPAAALALLIGIIAKVLGTGTGIGVAYLILSFFLLVVMFIVGTVARATVGTLSNLLLLIVALSGSVFGKNIGGGLASTILALACAQISKRALSGTKGFGYLQWIAFSITKKFGTSFRHAKLANANFSQLKIRNADFSNADVSSVNWSHSKKINCIATANGNTVIEK